MTDDTKQFLNKMLHCVSEIGYVSPENIPDIDLYMDQVTTFMESQLSASKRYEDDKILTKTMINNYAKNSLLPSPEKKKYSNEHLLVLIFIYYMKNMLSINDIKTLLHPLTEKYFQSSDGLNLSQIYDTIFHMEKNEVVSLKKDLLKKWKIAENTFTDVSEDDQQLLQKFSFICLLSFDVYMKKMILEHILDESPEHFSAKNKKEKKKK